MSGHFERALLLYEQSRHELAERELRQALAEQPNYPMAHALLALCLAASGKFQDATSEAQNAIHLSPDLAFAHYALASVLEDRNRLNEAEQAIHEAIRLDPESVTYHGRLATILFSRRRWADALDAAETGLQLDAEDVACNNLRAMALVKLGRRQEAGQTIEAALARDPDNAVTHANQGWTLLEANDPAKALEHFREALRIDPTSEWARLGIVEALKARHFVYRTMLKYFLWMAKLSGKMQWGVVIGGYVVFQMLRGWANANPEIAPFVWPLLFVYIAFVYLTWIAMPLFNLLLRLNKFGRLALSDEQIRASNWIGGCLLFVIVAAVITVAFDVSGAFLAALAGLALVVPLSATFNCQAGWPRNSMAAYTGVLALVAAGAIVTFHFGRDDGWLMLWTPFLIGVFCSSIAANVLASVRVRR